MTKTNDHLSPLFEALTDDFDYCEAVIKKHSKTFYTAFSKLSKQRAMSVYAVYAFCRRADDVIDEKQSIEELEQLEKELRAFEQGQAPDTPVWRALRAVFETYEMEFKPFYEMIDGQRQDNHFQQPETQEALEDYCYYVASTVGLMLLPILTDKPKDLQEQAIALGKAMQITNILRDVGEDWQDKRRIYLPKQKMQAFGYTQEDLKHFIINDNFIRLWEDQAERAEDLYTVAAELAPELHDDCVRPLLYAALFYHEILEEVRRNDYNCLTKRHYVSEDRKRELMVKAKQFLEE